MKWWHHPKRQERAPWYKKQSSSKQAKQYVLKKYQYGNDLGHWASNFELEIHSHRGGEKITAPLSLVQQEKYVLMLWLLQFTHVNILSVKLAEPFCQNLFPTEHDTSLKPKCFVDTLISTKSFQGKASEVQARLSSYLWRERDWKPDLFRSFPKTGIWI